MSQLRLDVDNKLDIQSEALIGVSAAILGITGSGKSNSASVLVEELLSSGFPMTIVDIEGEYWGLKEKFEILVAGRGEHADVEVGLEHAEKLADLSARRRIPVILDMSEFSQDEMFDFLLPYFKKLWEVCSALRQPYQVILEEAHEFVPQGTRTPLKEILTRIALRGRKRGLATVLVSQRSPKVDKDLLTQTPLVFLHKVIHPVDLRVYQDLIPLPARQVDEIVGALSSGEAVVLFRNTPTVARIRLRDTFHAGATPSLAEAPLPKLREIDKAILDELRATPDSSADAQPVEPSKNDLKAAQEIAELKRQVELLKAENQRLCEQLKNSIVKPAASAQLDIVPKTQSEAPPASEQAPAGEESPYRSSQAKYRSTKRQQELFDYLLKDILKLRKMQQKMLRYLVEREGRVFSVRDIAKATDISQVSIEHGGDIDLIQLELVQRTGKGSSRRYTSNVGALFQREFPELDQDRLRETLLYKLMHREVNHR